MSHLLHVLKSRPVYIVGETRPVIYTECWLQRVCCNYCGLHSKCDVSNFVSVQHVVVGANSCQSTTRRSLSYYTDTASVWTWHLPGKTMRRRWIVINIRMMLAVVTSHRLAPSGIDNQLLHYFYQLCSKTLRHIVCGTNWHSSNKRLLAMLLQKMTVHL